MMIGYECIAISTTIDLITPSRKKQDEKKNGQMHLVPEASLLRIPAEVLGSEKGPVKQYSRITARLAEPGGLVKLGTGEFQNYDIIAVEPTNEKMFMRACNVLDVDIITFNLAEHQPFWLKRAQMSAAIKRGVFFEICYSHSISDYAEKRQRFISNAIELVDLCKGKNIILSSGCKKAMNLRSPDDVLAMKHLLNMTEKQACATLTTNCRSVILRGQSRQFAKSTISMIPLKDLSEKDQWMVAACKNYRSKKKRKTQESDASLSKVKKQKIT
ncbi:ribonuclease P protein subunit p30-like isoform X2 [Lineus longissimus]|uniref:ribonuclease P protein subunit p30-like isoform X2 n=1 Tax=Lineus longissimus TaxID=88925 RepID=UPI002B4E288D